MLEHNTTQFSHGHRVLCSDDPNHVNLCIHRIHLELATKRLNVFPTKEPQRAAPEQLRWKCHKTTSIFGASGRGKQLACGANRRFLIFSSIAMVSMAASSHPSHRERESERETTSRSRAGRSRQPRGLTDITTVVLESQPTTGMTASLPTAVGPDATLLAARQLLNNPPPTGASPSAAEQWRHDVNQLVITTINTPHREGRCQPSTQQSCFPSAAQAPPRLPGARHWCSTTRQWPPTGRQTSERRSIAIEVGRTVAPSSSATARGVKTSRVTASRETSTCMH
jgi:hypothetical protein